MDYRDLEPKLPVQRYEHALPGDLLHLDIKKLGRIERPSHRVTGDRRDSVQGAGWEYVHVAIDDHSRIAFSAIYPDETQASVLKHRFTRPYTPRTDGKAERFIQTAAQGAGLHPLLRQLKRTQPGAPPLAAPIQLASAS